MTHTGTSEISALLAYTRALQGTRNWGGAFPMASMRRLEQTLLARRPLDFSDIQAAASIFQYALSERCLIDPSHKDHLIALSAQMFPGIISEKRLKQGTLLLTQEMRVPSEPSDTLPA